MGISSNNFTFVKFFDINIGCSFMEILVPVAQLDRASPF